LNELPHDDGTGTNTLYAFGVIQGEPEITPEEPGTSKTIA
jgi:hypothetical protein